jgi:hypothetical protein
MAAGFVDRLTDEVERHALTFAYFRYAKVSMDGGARQTRFQLSRI